VERRVALHFDLWGTKSDASVFDGPPELFETFEDFAQFQQVLAGEHTIQWSAADLPMGRPDETTSEIDLGLVRLFMVTAQV
jgi:hypothetical protein